MKIHVEHLDIQGNYNNLEINLSFLKFIKHLAFAGMGANSSIYNAFRFAGFMFEFIPYWKHAPYYFWLPEIVMHDPTELGQISNRIGKALADYLAKHIYGAKYTHNYEDAMVQHGYPIKGQRPDLYCDTLTKQFAIEAKGYKRRSVSSNEMIKHKSQSRTGPVPVHFSVASVAFNIYEEPKVKFHDPVGENIEYSKEVNIKLRSYYYQSILETIKQLELEPSFQVERVPLQFFAYQLPKFGFSENLYLLVHDSIVKGEWRHIQSFTSDSDLDDEEIYIDVDGIGLCIR